MTSTTSNQPYLIRAIHQWILDNDLTPHLLVNAEYPDVEVPAQSVQNGQIVLNITPHAISNLQMDNEAISFTARFSGVAQQLYIPIGAVKALYASENGEGMSFQEVTDADADADADADELNNLSEEDIPSEDPPDKKPPFLKVIK